MFNKKSVTQFFLYQDPRLICQILIPIPKIDSWKSIPLAAAHTKAHLCHSPSRVFQVVYFSGYCLTFVSFIGIKCHITLAGASFSKVKYCV